MPRPPSRDRQVIDPRAAFQMVHILEGVVERGTATILRDLDRPLFGKTGTTNGPTNVWFIGGTPEVVAGVYIGYDQPRPMGHGAQGGRIAAPIFKQFAKTAFKDMPKVPFVAPAGIRWARVDRASGRIVFGTFPTTEDPKSGVIWEAFQPQTEPRRAFRRSQYKPYADPDEWLAAARRDPRAAAQNDRRTAAQAQRQRPPRPVRTRPRPQQQPPQQQSQPAPTAPAPQPTLLPTQNSVQ